MQTAVRGSDVIRRSLPDLPVWYGHELTRGEKKLLFFLRFHLVLVFGARQKRPLWRADVPAVLVSVTACSTSRLCICHLMVATRTGSYVTGPAVLPYCLKRRRQGGGAKTQTWLRCPKSSLFLSFPPSSSSSSSACSKHRRSKRSPAALFNVFIFIPKLTRVTHFAQLLAR